MMVIAFLFSLQVLHRHGISPRTAPMVSTCRVCPNCCWLSAVCKELQSVLPTLPLPACCFFPSLFGCHFLSSSFLSPNQLSCHSLPLCFFLYFIQHLLYARSQGFRRKCCMQHPCPSGTQFQVGKTERKFKITTQFDKY